MNIFRVDNDPVKSAQMLCDKHIVKMPLETAQMLCSVWHRYNFGHLVKYKEAYKNHPCTRWCGDSRGNFEWAAQHAIALAEEYTYRYGKKHSCEDAIRYMAQCSWLIPEGDMTPFAQAMPDEYKNQCAVTAYKDYYWKDKRVNIDVKWNKKRIVPEWWEQLESVES